MITIIQKRTTVQNEPDNLTPDSVLAAVKFTSIARNEQQKRDTNGVFWALVIGFIIGTMFAVSYAMYH